MTIKQEIEVLKTEDQALVLFYLLGRYKGDKEFEGNIRQGLEYVKAKNNWKVEQDIDLDWYSDRWDILTIAGYE